ncbi:MAG: gluconate 2-dehydrogenase subunit 3 family protein [Cyclobacteriaceae bacterium]|nr:gluconate 2-dehydrogenase subunit 3 family protein [Cyclobacteriaceae bacterium]
MNRRQALKSSATALVSLGALPGLSALLKSCGVERLTDYQPVYLSTDQFDTIWQLANLILPQTDTPGASEAGVAPYIDLLFESFFKDDEKQRLESGLNAFMRDCEDQENKPFVKINTQQQMKHLEEIQSTEFFSSFKQLVLWAFFTSEVGTKSMNYRPVPGQHQGCITIDENEKNLVGNR